MPQGVVGAFAHEGFIFSVERILLNRGLHGLLKYHACCFSGVLPPQVGDMLLISEESRLNWLTLFSRICCRHLISNTVFTDQPHPAVNEALDLLHVD